VLSLQDDLARAVAEQVTGGLSPREQSQLTAQARQVRPEAYEAYLKGGYFFRQETLDGFARSRDYYEKAIALDPGFAAAYTGLAESLEFQAYSERLPASAWNDAEALLQHALRLDPDSALAHTLLGMNRLLFHCDRAAAEQELNRALTLDPGDLGALDYHSYYLLGVGRTDEAIAEKRRVLARDPVSARTSAELGGYLAFAGRNLEAVDQLESALELDGGYTMARARLATVLGTLGRYDEAIEQVQKALAVERAPFWVGKLGYFYAVVGRRDEARGIIHELTGMSAERFVPPWLIARIYAALGDRNEALGWLARNGGVDRNLAKEPGFELLRSDPAFVAMMPDPDTSAGCTDL
jgi:tetratricopeptide (TPR) repeat protein